VRRRLTIAILAVVVGTLVLSVAGGLFLVQRASIKTAENEITGQAESLGGLLSTNTFTADQRLISVLKKVGSYAYLAPVGLSPDGSFETLPSPLSPSNLDVTALENNQTVVGNVGQTVFVAVPISLNLRERRIHQIPATDLPVLIVTRTVTSTVNGLDYFLLVAGAVLVIGTLVAALLARRISAPIVRAVRTTRRIASGDLSARVPVDNHDDPELAELAEAINSMGDSLGRSRGLERQFLLSVSHELRTPLTSIRGYADAVADGAAEDVGAAAAVISSEARRLERLVQDLLDLARLDARQFSFHPQRVDVVAIVEGVADGFRPEAAGLGLDLASVMPAGGAGGPGGTNVGDVEIWVDADPDRLAQIVANLVENAFKFASSRVEVGAASSGAWCVLWVSDDGAGIDSADLPRVFDRHFRSDRTHARRVGTGLGLAIVAELASVMGASVRAESPLADGRGTRMVVSLPLAQARPSLWATSDEVKGSGRVVDATASLPSTPQPVPSVGHPPSSQSSLPPPLPPPTSGRGVGGRAGSG